MTLQRCMRIKGTPERMIIELEKSDTAVLPLLRFIDSTIHPIYSRCKPFGVLIEETESTYVIQTTGIYNQRVKLVVLKPEPKHMNGPKGKLP